MSEYLNVTYSSTPYCFGRSKSWSCLRHPGSCFLQISFAKLNMDNDGRHAILDGTYFSVSSSDGDKVKARCAFCKSVISGAYSSTSNFKLHLKVRALLLLCELFCHCCSSWFFATCSEMRIAQCIGLNMTSVVAKYLRGCGWSGNETI